MIFGQLIEVLDPEPHDAALNMAIDEMLLRAASSPTLRIYRWARPSVSFGYFEKWEVVSRTWPGRDIVRRWTGGGIVPHGADVTYSLIVPRAHPFCALSPRASYAEIHAVLARLLGAASLAGASPPKISAACFENPAQNDVMIAGRKVAGAAQRRTRLGLLHQGSIQTGGDIAEIAAAMPAAFAAQVTPAPLDTALRADARRLAEEKYATAGWTRRI